MTPRSRHWRANCQAWSCSPTPSTLLHEFGVYVQPINYPIVPRGTERLRLTPTPLHGEAEIDHLVRALTIILSNLYPSRAA